MAMMSPFFMWYFDGIAGSGLGGPGFAGAADLPLQDPRLALAAVVAVAAPDPARRRPVVPDIQGGRGDPRLGVFEVLAERRVLPGLVTRERMLVDQVVRVGVDACSRAPGLAPVAALEHGDRGRPVPADVDPEVGVPVVAERGTAGGSILTFAVGQDHEQSADQRNPDRGVHPAPRRSLLGSAHPRPDMGAAVLALLRFGHGGGQAIRSSPESQDARPAIRLAEISTAARAARKTAAAGSRARRGPFHHLAA